MLVVDASCLFEILVGTPSSSVIGERLLEDSDHAAPHIVDVEVLGILRRERLAGRLDATAADQAVQDLRDWPGERYGHRHLLLRAWELRSNVRGWDAVYVALAESFGATLLTMDQRLARVNGLRCHVDALPGT